MPLSVAPWLEIAPVVDWAMTFLVVELRHGPVGRIRHAGRDEPSAIGKVPSAGPLWLGPDGFDGDTVADRKHHGGPDKAVCVYAARRYDGWAARYGAPLPRPAFGENLLVSDPVGRVDVSHAALPVDEDTVCVGDVYALGGAVVEVSQPRVPCYKPAAFTGEPRLTVDLRATGWTGWYLRVRVPGQVAPGDVGRLVARPDGAASVGVLNALRYGPDPDPERLEAVAAAPGLTDAWRAALLSRRRT